MYKKGPYYMPQVAPGVYNSLGPQRTEKDMQLQHEFDRDAKENFVALRDFGPRTQKDLDSQSMFNSVLREGFNAMQVNRLSDNPYNPYSKIASHLSIR